MSQEGPKGNVEQMPIEISPVSPEDYGGTMEVLYKAQLENYPNEKLGITREDVEANFEEAFTEENIRAGEERWRSIPENPNTLYLVAKQNGKVIGRCIVNKESEMRPGKNQLEDIYIDPEAQGKGLGKKFWEQAHAFLDPSKDTVVFVLPYNEQAIGYYHRLGFSETGGKANNGNGTVMRSGAVMPVPIEMIRMAEAPAA
jgi:ribosomal protein S18 acetylase RimI-like enzyme